MYKLNPKYLSSLHPCLAVGHLFKGIFKLSIHLFLKIIQPIDLVRLRSKEGFFSTRCLLTE